VRRIHVDRFIAFRIRAENETSPGRSDGPIDPISAVPSGPPGDRKPALFVNICLPFGYEKRTQGFCGNRVPGAGTVLVGAPDGASPGVMADSARREISPQASLGPRGLTA